jgi:hypothetical protein
MDTVMVLRELWRLRRYVAVVCVLALLTGAALISREYTVGVATARILVDTPKSQVADVSPKGSGLVALQANLLATIMVDGTIKSAIAQRVGVKPNELVGVTTAATDPSASGSSPVSGSSGPSAPSGPDAYALTTQIMTDNAGNTLPIIQLSAQAPTAAAASRLGNAAISSLNDYVVSKAAAQRIPHSDRLNINALNSSPAATEVRGPSKLIGVVVVLLVILIGCAAILGIQALVRGWRAASALEKAEDVPPVSGDLAFEDERRPSLGTEEDSFREALRAHR